MFDYHYYYFLLYNVNINQTRKYLKYKIKFKNYLDLQIIRNQGQKLKSKLLDKTIVSSSIAVQKKYIQVQYKFVIYNI